MQAYTISNPNAMMVHSHNTSIALGTVMSPWWLDCLAEVTSLPELLPDQLHFLHVKRAHLPNLDVLLAL